MSKKQKLCVAFYVFIVIFKDCPKLDPLRSDNFPVACPSKVLTFSTKEELARYLRDSYDPLKICVGPCVEAYEAKPMKYDVKPIRRIEKTYRIKEVGRNVEFK